MGSLRKIIVVRTAQAEEGGIDNRDPHLTAQGRHQARELGAKVREHVEGPVLLLASNSNRGQEMADLLKEVLELEASPIYDNGLWHDSFHQGDRTGNLIRLVSKSLKTFPDTETLIIVGHRRHGGSLAAAIMAERDVGIQALNQLGPGEACVVDVLGGRVSLV